MKTLLVPSVVPLLCAIACGPTVAETTESATTREASTGALVDSTSSGGDPSFTGGDSGSGDRTDDSSSTSNTEVATETTAADSSSSGGAAVVCGSPLLDPGDRLNLAGAPMRGNPDGLVTLVVWTGYADRFSRNVQSTLDALMDSPLGDELRIVSKQMPLPFQDPRGRLARAALAAHTLNAYWPFHDAMFAADQPLESAELDAIALEVGLDLEAFHSAMEGPEVSAQLAGDMELFSAVGAKGTPSSVINGKLVTGAQLQPAFEEIVTAQRASMEALIEEGLPPCAAFEQRLDDQLP